MDGRLLDTVEGCRWAVSRLLHEEEVAIDIEGVALSRQGEICLIQICGSSSQTPIYLFDIHVLGAEAFEAGGLKTLLEAEWVTKVFFDVRGDNDALHHQFGVDVRGAYDAQVLWHLRFQHPEDPYLQGLKRVQDMFLEESGVLTPRSVAKTSEVKDAGQRLFAPGMGGSYSVWKERPLSPELVRYATADVKFLIDMRRHWSFDDVARAQALDAGVRQRSAERIHTFVALPDERALDQAAKRMRDFDIPGGDGGFNDTGAVSQRVSIPQNKRGRVIGKGGSKRLAIETQSGARVIVREGEDGLLLGQPDQVHAAARIIRELVS